MSKTESPVVKAERRAWNYWFIDGLSDILSGAGAVLLAFSFEIDKKRSISSLVTALCCFLLYFLVIFRREKMLEWLKSRITYPRTGYVPYPYKPAQEMTQLRIDEPDQEPVPEVRRARRNRSFRSLLAIVPMGAAVLLLGAIDTPWVCLPASALFGLALWRFADLESKRSLPIALGMCLVGLAMSLFRVEGTPRRLDVLLAGAGTVLMIEGTVTLIRYLWQNPARQA